MASIHRLPVKTQDESDSATLSVQLLRAKYAVDVAEALYRMYKLSPHARLADAPAHESRAHFMQIAEAAGMLVVDAELRESAEYYAADALYGGLADLPAGKRINRVKDVAEALRAYLRFLSGFYPPAIEQYRKLVRSDRAALKAARS